MKGLSVAMFFLFFNTSFGQYKEHITWGYNLEKVDSATFLVHLVATLDKDWHVYSNNQPKNSVCQRTVLTYGANTGVSFDGPVKEVGDVIHYLDTVADIGANQYENKVEFVRMLTVDKNNDIEGKSIGQIDVLYQVCSGEICYRPVRKSIKITGPSK